MILNLDWWELTLSVLCVVLAGAVLHHSAKSKETPVHVLTALAVMMQAAYFLLMSLNIAALETANVQIQLRDIMARPATAAAFLGITLILLNGDFLWALQRRFPTSS